MSYDAPPIDYDPRPLPELQARYAAALEHVFDAQRIKTAGAIRPGECAANVFDFEDGLRLICSRERMPAGEIVLHVSASFRSDSSMAWRMRKQLRKLSRSELLEAWSDGIPARWQELAQDRRTLVFIGWSDRFIPHWHIVLEPTSNHAGA